MGNDYSTPGAKSQGAIRLQIIIQPFSASYAKGLGIPAPDSVYIKYTIWAPRCFSSQGIVSTGSSV